MIKRLKDYTCEKLLVEEYRHDELLEQLSVVQIQMT